MIHYTITVFGTQVAFKCNVTFKLFKVHWVQEGCTKRWRSPTVFVEDKARSNAILYERNNKGPQMTPLLYCMSRSKHLGPSKPGKNPPPLKGGIK